MKRLVHFILFGNYFLAFCIVALSAESAVKNGFYLLDPYYYLLVFLCTVLYYTHAYIGDKQQAASANPRSQWYHNNRVAIRFMQIVYTVLIAGLGVSLFLAYYPSLLRLSIANWLVIISFPLVAILYYGVIFPARLQLHLRNIAWLKPFIIGFVCTGFVTVYPLVFRAVQWQQPFVISSSELCYFITNWLFTSAIAIMFDIKDFAADHNYRLKTFVVTRGLRYTITLILLPLAVGSFASFFVFALLKHFSAWQIALNSIPFCLLLAAAASLRRRKNILYYLVVIDGLLLVKAAFGIAVMLLVK